MTGLEIAGFALIAIGAAILAVACWAQRREIERLQSQSDDNGIRWLNAMTRLEAIAAATATGKSGTARKVHRMAKEALK